jgi:hypothetical protein
VGTDPAEIADSKVVGASTVERIGWLTLAIGFAAALGTEIVSRRWRWAAGIAAGTLLGWLNFQLLQRGAAILLTTSQAQESDEKPRLPVLGAILRYGLMGLSVYVIFEYLHVPLVSLMTGLCAFAVATITASIWAILNPEE